MKEKDVYVMEKNIHVMEKDVHVMETVYVMVSEGSSSGRTGTRRSFRTPRRECMYNTKRVKRRREIYKANDSALF